MPPLPPAADDGNGDDADEDKDSRLERGQTPAASQNLRPQDVPASTKEATTSRDVRFSTNVRHEAKVVFPTRSLMLKLKIEPSSLPER